jgi:class 3 adenylate cyclase/tetratricopeptide (TPR) repeat protein
MAANLVTILFTDLVDSTQIKSLLAGSDIAVRNSTYFETILAPHRRKVEAELAAMGGRVVTTEGDAYFLIFSDAAQAARWAIEVQRSHELDPIATPRGPLQVKIGVHVGAPLPDPEDPKQFVGQEVDYAARVIGLARGGQILLSESAAALMRDAKIDGASFHAHGLRSLKGIGLVPIFELLHDRLTARPLKEPVYAPSNLPPPPEGFVGRDALLDGVRVSLRTDGCTILKGEGGMGKTALALMAARGAHVDEEFAGGVAWISCESNPSRDECIRQLAAVFFGDRMENVLVDACAEKVAEHLQRGPGLAVFDNFETVAADSGLIRWLGSLRPPARVLITTREVPPALRGAIVPVQELAGDDAVSLFAGRASRAGLDVGGQMDQIRELCTAVGGQPLAIELLAARATRLPLRRLIERVGRDLEVVDSRGDYSRPERHQSVRTCMRFSYEHLSEPARELLLRMSVLPDGAGEAVVSAIMMRQDWDEAAEELVQNSVWRLLGRRFTLHPLVRQFALEEIGARRNELERAAAKSLIFFVHARAEQSRFGAATPEQLRAAIDWCENELRNLIACSDFAYEAEDWQSVDWLSCAIFRFFQVRGHWATAESLYQKALTAATRANDRAARARALYHLGLVYRHQGRWNDAESLLNESLTLARELRDSKAEGNTLKHLGRVHQLLERYEQSETALREALAILHAAGDPIGEAKTYLYLGNLYRFGSRWDEARDVYEQALRLSRQVRDRYDEGEVLRQLGRIHQVQGRFTEAKDAYEQSLSIWREFTDRLHEATILDDLGTLYRDLGQWPESASAHERSLALFRSFHHRHKEGVVLFNLARLRHAEGRDPEALAFANQAVAILGGTEDAVALGRARELQAELGTMTSPASAVVPANANCAQ